MADLFGAISAELSSRIFSGVLFFGVAVLLIGVVGFLMYYFLVYSKKFDIKVKIRSHRADDQYSTMFDKAAILRDRKTNIPYFRVWGLKREFPVPNFKVLQKTNKGDYLEIYRKSEEEFYFLTPSKIDNTRLLKSNGQVIPLSDQEQTQVDPEMAFWAVKRKNMNRKMFDTESMLMKLLPFIPQIIGGVITIFVLYILMDTLPQILSQLQSLAATMNQNVQASQATITTG